MMSSRVRRERGLTLRRETHALQQKIENATDSGERRRLIVEIKGLRAELARVDPKAAQGKPKDTDKTPSPKSYFEAMRAKREAAHKVSGFNRIRARFVQGGGGGG